jgi:hypothetical protein
MTIETFINILLIISYVLMAISLVAVIVFPLYHMFADFAKAKGALLGLLGVVVLFGISFMVSDNEVLPAYEKFNITPMLSQLIGSSLVMNYIIGVGVIVIAAVGELLNAFK